MPELENHLICGYWFFVLFFKGNFISYTGVFNLLKFVQYPARREEC